MLDSNGAPSAPLPSAPAASNGSANGVSNGANGSADGNASLDASFWQRPLDQAGLSEIIWHPPLPSHRASHQATLELLNEVTAAHADPDSSWGGEAKPYQSWYLRWFFETRALAAQHELEDVLSEVRSSSRSYAALLQDARAASAPTRQAAQDVLREGSGSPNALAEGAAGANSETPETPERTLDSLLARARHDFTSAAAQAGIYVETTPHAPENPESPENQAASTSTASGAAKSVGARAEGVISPRLVEEALDRTAPNVPEIAGMHHLRFPLAEWNGDSEHAGFLQKLSGAALSLAPLVLGLMVALCLGSVSGLLDIEDLTRRPDVAKAFKFALAIALGGVIVTVLGKGMEATIRTVFDHLSTPTQSPPKADASTEEGYRTLQAFRANTPPAPRRRRSVVLSCVLLLVAFAIAETVAEGTGLKTLNDLRIANMSQLQQRQYNANPIAPWIFYLIGVLFSGAYLYYKGTDTWRKSELETMRPWLERQRQEWFERQRSQPNVQALFQLAYLIEQMEAKRSELLLRLDNARAAAVSEAELMHAMLEWIVNSHGPMPLPTLHMIKSFEVSANGANVNGSGVNGGSGNGNGANGSARGPIGSR